MTDTILIAEHDPTASETLYKVMKSNQLNAIIEENVETALAELSAREYALLLLDLELPGTDAYEVIRTLRSSGESLPIIVLGSQADESSVLRALDVGADGFLLKPFNPVTLGAKVKAMIRRSRGSLTDTQSILSAGPFTYNTSTLRLFKDGTEIVLTSKENALMKLFLDNVNRIFSRDMLYELVWGDTIVDDNAVMVYINHLRQKIEDDPENPKFIQNVRGIGYRLVV